jgi:sporulation protein YlmC with PRC-barrel domain
MTKLTWSGVILASALAATPVFAQTAGSGAGSTARQTDQNTMMQGRATDRTVTSANRSDSSDSTYWTADHKLRTSKVVGATVYNDQDQSIGKIDDILVNRDDKTSTVVISVGGFLGVGSKLVAVPYDQLKVEHDKITLPGASEASLKGLPDYHYSNA